MLLTAAQFISSSSFEIVTGPFLRPHPKIGLITASFLEEIAIPEKLEIVCVAYIFFQMLLCLLLHKTI